MLIGSAVQFCYNHRSRKKKTVREAKTMIYFNCDYNEGAHPSILHMLEETNM